MSATKTYRHGQILRLVGSERIANQEDLRRRLAQQRLRVTQATLSRDLQELKLIKTTEGYKTDSALPDEPASVPPLTRALREFLLDIRPAENLLVLKRLRAGRSRWPRPWTPPSSLKSPGPSPGTTRS